MPRGKKKAAAVAAPAEPIVVPSDLTDLITKWHAAEQQLAKAKQEEHALRQAVVLSTFDMTKLEGTDTVEIGWGCQLRLTRVLAYNATNDAHECEQLLAIVAALDPGLALELVRWKPEVAKKPYRALLSLAEDNPLLKEALAHAVTLKPGMPQLEIVPPKTDVAPIIVENIPA